MATPPSTTSPPQHAPCSFSGCPKPPMDASTKCSFHRNRTQCKVPHCANQVYARQLCVRHGGKKVCATPGCTSHACGGGHCPKHGGVSSKRFCLVEGCQKQAHKHHKCVRHGGGRYCKTPRCTSHARFKGYCLFHSEDLEPIQLCVSSRRECREGLELDAIDSAILACLAPTGPEKGEDSTNDKAKSVTCSLTYLAPRQAMANLEPSQVWMAGFVLL